MSYDVAVLGGGTGGYVAAIRAAQLGMRTAVIERDRVGGTCLHRGCIPTKLLLHVGDLLHAWRGAERFGLELGTPRWDWEAIRRRQGEVVQRLFRGVQGLLARNGVEVIRGEGRLVAPDRLAVRDGGGDERRLDARSVLVATGSRPRPLPDLPFDGERVWSSDHAIAPASPPERLLVIGAGASGVEFASMYADLGARVTLLEAAPRILPGEDPDVSEAVARGLARRGIEVRAGVRVRPLAGGLHPALVVADPEGREERFEGDVVLVAIGRLPNVEGIGLEACGVEVGPGGIAVDSLQRTSVPGIYAFGDVTGGFQLAHAAAAQGRVAVEHLAGLDPEPFDPLQVPRCTYGRPPVASVGLSEPEALARGHRIRVGRFPWRANARAVLSGEVEGMVKVILDAETDRVLGLHLVGEGATELIAEGSLGVREGLSGARLAASIRPHPSLSEAVGEAVWAAQGRPLHLGADPRP